jgi:STAS domain-containing protein
MSVNLKSQGVIELRGRCSADDAEVLQQHLLAMPGDATVEWSHCEYLHSAVVQVLLAGEPLVRGTPKNKFLATHIAPILGGRRINH